MTDFDICSTYGYGFMAAGSCVLDAERSGIINSIDEMIYRDVRVVTFLNAIDGTVTKKALQMEYNAMLHVSMYEVLTHKAGEPYEDNLKEFLKLETTEASEYRKLENALTDLKCMLDDPKYDNSEVDPLLKRLDEIDSSK